jgi:TRAP-type C4-dicarboxylate transport system substrate-binding protein
MAAAQETRLLFTSLSPGGGGNSIFFNQWAQRVNDQSGGTLKVEVRDGVTLANYGNVYDRVNDDVVQIGWAIHQVLGGRFPLSEVAGLPFVSDGGATGSLALWRLYKSGALDNEYKDIVPLCFVVFGPAQVHFGKPPKSVDDLGGLKIAVQGKLPSDLVSAMGGTPISIQPGDMYEALQRGTADGSIISWSGFAPYKLQEVSIFHIEAPLGQSTSMFFMSKKKYDALPANVRRVLDANSGETMTRSFGKFFTDQWTDSRAPVAGAPQRHHIVGLTAAQSAAWQAKASPLISDWAKNRPGGDKTLEAYRALFAQAKTGG